MKPLIIPSGSKYFKYLTFECVDLIMPTIKSLVEEAVVFYNAEGKNMNRTVFISTFLNQHRNWNIIRGSDDINRIVAAMHLIENVFNKQWQVFCYYAERNEPDKLLEAVNNGAESPGQMLFLENKDFCEEVCGIVNSLETRIFVDDIDSEDVRAIIMGNSNKTYKLVRNSLAAALFGNLAQLGLITFEWSYRIGYNAVLISSHGPNVLTSRDLTSAWSRVRNSDKKEYSHLRKDLRGLYDRWKSK